LNRKGKGLRSVPYFEDITLYVDVDDTWIAHMVEGSGFDLRPNAMTQLRGLTMLYDVQWLTCWPPEPLRELLHGLYAPDVWMYSNYCAWRTRMELNKGDKVDAVLNGNPNWYWIEDPLPKDEFTKLVEAGVQDRYIRVEPHGTWGFLDAIHKLFALTSVDSKVLWAAGINPKWFEKF